MPRKSSSYEAKLDAAIRRRQLAASRFAPYAPSMGMGLSSYNPMGPMGALGMPGAAAQRRMMLQKQRQQLQLSMNGMTLPAKTWASLNQLKGKTWTEDKLPKPTELFDHDGLDGSKSLNDDVNKGKILMFTDDVVNDYWSSMLSPMVGGPIQINVPVPATYKSPMHYVEGMKVISSSTPGMLLGGVAQAVFNGEYDSCDLAKSQIDYTLQNPYAQMVSGSTKVCDEKAVKTHFWKVESEPCKFWTSLWLALFSKHMARGAASARGSYHSALLSTGNKLLIYKSENSTYGVEDKTALEGANAVGVILMILRALAKKGQLVEQNAGAAWEQIAKPILTTLYGKGDEGRTFI